MQSPEQLAEQEFKAGPRLVAASKAEARSHQEFFMSNSYTGDETPESWELNRHAHNMANITCGWISEDEPRYLAEFLPRAPVSDALINAYRFQRRAHSSPVPAASALEQARKGVAAGVKRYASGPGLPLPLPGSQEGVRRAAWPVTQTRYVEILQDAGLRLVGYSDEVASRHQGRADHKGWYADAFQDCTFRGVVLQLSARKGAVRFIAAYQSSEENGYVLDLSPRAVFTELADDTSTDPLDFSACRYAALAADSFASSEADKACEYDKASNAGIRFAELGEEIGEVRKEALRLIREAKSACDVLKPGSAMREAIATRIEELRRAIADAREQRLQLVADFGQADAFTAAAVNA